MPKYAEDDGASAASALESRDTPPAPREEGDEGASEATSDSDTFFIPAAALAAHCDPATLKPGQSLTFKVVGRDGDGDIEVAYSAGEEKGSSMDKMKSDMASDMSQPGEPS